MKPHSPTGARGVRLGRVLALAAALLLGLWLGQAVLIAATGAEPLLQLTPEAEVAGPAAAAAPLREDRGMLSGSPGGGSVVIDIGHNVILPNPPAYYAVTRIGIRERGHQPCVLTLWGRMVDPRYAEDGDRALATFELGRCRALSGWLDPASAGFPAHQRFIRALRVCGGHAGPDAPQAAYSSPAWQIAGLMVQPAAVERAAAEVAPLPDLDSFTRPRCPRQVAAAPFAAGWSGWSACPAGQLVAGLEAHYYDDRYLTGLSVRCKPVAWRAPGRAPMRDAAGY
jgi:hypothetical protein